MSTEEFYDTLSDQYSELYRDWEASVRRQGAWLATVLAGRSMVLDCSCGIGTQTLGLALEGFKVTGTDLSSKAIERAKREAGRFDVKPTFLVADMRRLEFNETFDAVIAFDNALPHFLNDEDLVMALVAIRKHLVPGGIFAASIRDYDSLLETKPSHDPLRVMPCGQKHRASFQLWDWDENIYTLTQFIIKPDENDSWTMLDTTTRYRALRRAELDTALTKAGFSDLRWLLPGRDADAFGQPVVLATTRK